MSDQPIYDKTAQGFSSVRVPSLPAVPVPHTEEDDKAAEEYAIRVLPDHLEHRFHPSVRKPFADAFLAGAQAGALRERESHNATRRVAIQCGQESADTITQLRSDLALAREALEYVKHRTEQCPEKGMHPHGFIRSTRMRGVVVDALARLENSK